MFKIIKKTDYWECLERFPDFKGSYGLKHIQDLFVLNRLREADGAKICEAGGGTSRVLARLCVKNECWNIDKLEGMGQGPSENMNLPSIRLVRAYMGDFSPDVPEEYFDYAISVSVVEHVPLIKLAPFFRDCMRVLKPGGLMLHAVDLYLPDREDLEDSSPSVARLRACLDAVAGLGPCAQWLENPEATERACARACHATNTDTTLFAWNKTVPALKDTRAQTQSCSLAMALRKMPAPNRL